MFGGFSDLRFRPCPECGGAVAKIEAETHICDPERWIEYQMLQQREELDRFDSEVGVYLASPHGQFELWYAERERRRAAASLSR
jgi:hypothetical protein